MQPGGSPRISSGSSSSAAHRRRHDLRLGVLGHQADGAAQLGGPVLANVEAGDLDLAGDLAAVVVGDQAAAGTQQRRLARTPSGPASTIELPGLDLEVDVARQSLSASG